MPHTPPLPDPQSATEPLHERYLEPLLDQLERIDGAPIDTEQALAAVQMRARIPSESVITADSATSRLGRVTKRHSIHGDRLHRGWRRAASVALAGAIVVVGGGMWWLRAHRALDTTNADSASSLLTTHARTANAQRAQFRLPDGTQVTLAPASQIRLRPGYGGTARHVVVEGEALFTVVPLDNAPFTVEIGGTTARVLGTTFGVRKYATDNAAHVLVATGKVAIGSTVLTNGDVATITAGAPLHVEHDAERVSGALGWASGRLVVDGQRFADVIPELNRWYDLDLRTSDPLLQNRLLQVRLDTESPTQAIALIAQVLEARYDRHGRVVTFRR